MAESRSNMTKFGGNLRRLHGRDHPGRETIVQATASSVSSCDPLAAQALLDRELRRVRRFATMLHDQRSTADLTAYERDLEAQLSRTRAAIEALGTALRTIPLDRQQ